MIKKIKEGMRVIYRLNGTKATITSIGNGRVNILDDGDLLTWSMSIEAMPNFFNEIQTPKSEHKGGQMSNVTHDDTGFLNCLDCDYQLDTSRQTKINSLKKTARRHKKATGHCVIVTYKTTWFV